MKSEDHREIPFDETDGRHIDWDDPLDPRCELCGSEAETFGCVECGGWECTESGEVLFQR